MIADEVKYCPRCGSVLGQSFLFGRVRPICSECNWVYFNDPKVAAGVLVERAGRVLLVRRVNEPERGHWSLPGGFVDAGEDPARAAERECLEETGLTVTVTALMDVLAGLEHPRGAHIVIFYRADLVSGNLLAGDDVDGAEFFSRDSLPPLAFRSTAQILARP